MSIETYYDKTVTFSQYDGTLDALGAPDYSTANYDAVHSNIPCMKRPMGATDKINRNKKVSDKMYFIYCQSLSITEDYLATIDSENHRIIGIKDPNSRGHHMEVETEVIL